MSSSLIAKMASCFAAVALPDYPQKDWDLSSLRLKTHKLLFQLAVRTLHIRNCAVLGWGRVNFLQSSSPTWATCKGNSKLPTQNYHYKMQSLHCQFYTKDRSIAETLNNSNIQSLSFYCLKNPQFSHGIIHPRVENQPSTPFWASTAH